MSNEPCVSAADILAAHPALGTKLARALFCDPCQCQFALTEVIKFLTLVADHEGRQLTPSSRVDLAWHEFILFTRVYIEFCEQNFGRYIHHEPGGDQAKHRRQHVETLTYYRQRFGEPPADFWPSSCDRGSGVAMCGNCESDL